MSTQPASGQAPAFDTSVAHQARIYNHWLGGKDNYAADRRAADEAAAAYPGVVSGARANREFAILHAISDDEDPWGIVASLLAAVPAGSYLVMSQPASDIDPDEIAEATKRLNRLSHQEFTLRGHAGVSGSSTAWNCCRRGWCGSRSGAPAPTSRAATCRPCGAG